MVHTVEGKVAKILSETHVIINVGSMQGIQNGTVFTIYAQGDEVTDPDTGEVLGKWEVPKALVVAVHVQDRLSTCEAALEAAEESDEDPSTRVLSADMIRVSMRPETLGTRRAKLNVNRSDISGMPRIGPVAVGDRARATVDLDKQGQVAAK